MKTVCSRRPEVTCGMRQISVATRLRPCLPWSTPLQPWQSRRC